MPQHAVFLEHYVLGLGHEMDKKGLSILVS